MTIKPRFINFVKLLFIILLTKVSYAHQVWNYGIDKAIQNYQEQVEKNKGEKRTPLDSESSTKFQTLFELCETFKDLWPEISNLETNRQSHTREENVTFFNDTIRHRGYSVNASGKNEHSSEIKDFVLSYYGLTSLFLSSIKEEFSTLFTFDDSHGMTVEESFKPKANELYQHVQRNYSHQIDQMSEDQLKKIICLENSYQATAKWQRSEKVKYVKQKFAHAIDQLEKGLRSYNIVYSWNAVITHAGFQQNSLKQEFIYRLIYEHTNDYTGLTREDKRTVLWLTEGLIEAYFIPMLKDKIIQAYHSQSSSRFPHQTVIKSVANDFQSCIPFYKQDRNNGYKYVEQIINDYQRQQNSASSSAPTVQRSFQSMTQHNRARNNHHNRGYTYKRNAN